jgi:peptide/nickel transport system ATP-binding protein
MTIAPRAGIPNVRLGGAIPNPAALPSGCRFHPRCPEAVAICSRITPPTNSDGLTLAECHLVSPRDGAVSGGRPTSPTAVAATPSSN